ncbi:MAG: outer membrane beta-barrel protein [Gammaproteobacteria bacterium]|nr:outer membrane beta-barrel protein [Gammaproteobacteria bacterium]
MNSFSPLLIAAMLWPLSGATAVQEDSPTPPPEEPDAAYDLSFNAGLGVKHDTNVAVLELDASTDASDQAALLDLGAGLSYNLTDKATVRADYALSHTEYDEFTDFNLTIHRGSLDAVYDFEAFDAGLSYHYIDALLDSSGFLNMRQTSPYLAKLFDNNVYVRGAYIHTDKRFDDNPSRDADSDAVSADVFVFFNDLKTYVVLGVKHSRENARADRFDYDGNQLSAQLSHKVPFGGRDLQLRSQLRYETRDYDAITPSIGAQRDDDRYRFDASAAWPLGDRLTATAEYEYADNRSNLSVIDFSEHVFTVRLDAKF